jgi:CTP synthase (UTP-ammonia lyase)
MRAVRVGLIGDYSQAVTAHRAIPISLEIAGRMLDCDVDATWLPTKSVENGNGDLGAFDGLWCVPASPYESFSGAIHAIRFAREQARPFLGTCGGFQHAVLEYARDVLGHDDAGHAEMDPETKVPLIAPLTCSLVERDGVVTFVPGTKLAQIYQRPSALERYHCRYGLNPAFSRWFEQGPLVISAVDANGDPRAVELVDHDFFIATAYQPERSGLTNHAHPLIVAFVDAASQ